MARVARTGETVARAHRASSASAAGKGVARDWWVIALRGLAALLFGAGVLTAPQPAVASLVWLFAVYIAADGALAVYFAARAGLRGERWRALFLEGAINLGVAAVVLIWPVLALVAFVPLTAAWAIVSGGALLAAAHRLSVAPGRRALAGAGFVSAAWGAAASAYDWVSGRNAGGSLWWLIGYAALFGGTLLLVAVQLQRHHRRTQRAA